MKIKKTLFLIITISILSSCAVKKEINENDYTGVWQFPNKSVWIEITSDNSVYQCRINKEKKAITSEGELVGNIITWNKIWDKDVIHRIKNTITLNGKYGKFNYVKTTSEMTHNCENPL